MNNGFITSRGMGYVAAARKELLWFDARAKDQEWPEPFPMWLLFAMASRTVRTSVNWSRFSPARYDEASCKYLSVFSVTLPNDRSIAFCCGKLARPVQYALNARLEHDRWVHVLNKHTWSALHEFWAQQRGHALRDQARTWTVLYQEFTEPS